MAFPTSVDSFSTKVDNVSTVFAADVNTLQTAVVAIENFILGGFAGTTAIDLVVRSVTAQAAGPYTQKAPTGYGFFQNGLAPLASDGFAGKGTVPLPTLSDSFNTWLLADNGVTGAKMTIVANQLTNTAVAGAPAGYAMINLGAKVTRIGADVTFSAGAVTGSFALAIWPTAIIPPTVPDTGFHWSLSPNQWVFGYWSGNVFTQLANGVYATALTQDGATAYRHEAIIIGNTAYFLLPDGTTAHVSDSHIGTTGNFASFETFQNNAATETRSAATSVWADVAQPDRRAYATIGDVTSTAEIMQTFQSPRWIPVGDLSVWTGQASAALGTIGAISECWLFANAVDNYLQTSVALPKNWTSIKITFRWANNGAGAGNVVWSYLILSAAPGANLTAAFGDHPLTVAAGAQNLLVDTVMTTAQPVTSGGLTLFRITRRASNVADTLANGVGLLGVLIEHSPAS